MKKVTMIMVGMLLTMLALVGCNETQVKDAHAKVQEACTVAQPTLATLTAMAVTPEEQLKFTELSGAVKIACNAPVLDPDALKHLTVNAIPEVLHLVATSTTIPEADRNRIQEALVALQIAVTVARSQAGGT